MKQLVLKLFEGDNVIRGVNRVFSIPLICSYCTASCSEISNFLASSLPGSPLRLIMTINDAPALAFSHATANLPALRDS